jgi:hypothetical protein
LLRFTKDSNQLTQIVHSSWPIEVYLIESSPFVITSAIAISMCSKRFAVSACFQDVPSNQHPQKNRPRQGHTDISIVAWHEVPRLLKEPSRRVRYDRARLITGLFLAEMCAASFGKLNARLESFEIPYFDPSITNRWPHLHEPYHALRFFWDGALPGTSCQATIASSLRDISQQALEWLEDEKNSDAAKQLNT